ncbi:MAG TPA: alpha/beta hydrolase [Ktedonobacterales bacterium]
MSFVTANGLRFFLRDEGAGDPVILLHGFPDTSAVWRGQIPALVGAGYRVIAPDLRGRGQTERPEGVAEYALSKSVADVAALMDALDLPRAHIVGHDWGAAVAWLCAAALPQRVERLAALQVGHPATRERPTLESLEKSWYRLLFQFEGIESTIQADDWYLLRTLFGDAADVEGYIATLSEPGALTAGLNWYRANLPATRLMSPPPQLPPIQAPTLGIFGADDRYLNESAMLASAQFTQNGWRYERIAQAGHWAQLDAAEQVNRLLLEFLSVA